MIITARPDFSKFFIPQQPFRKKLYDLINSNKFESVIMACIILNIVSMALVFEGSSDKYKSVLEGINYFFTSVFILEMLFKLTALGFKGYWINGWNKFDFFVVMASIIDIILGIVTSGGSSFLRVGPQLARVVRVLRVSRLLKLIKSF